MNGIEYTYPIEDRWEPVTQVVFYEPRTIPAGWDMSEYLPAASGAQLVPQFTAEEDQ